MMSESLPNPITVAFNRTKADQALSKAVQVYLDAHPQVTFSDLCKQALRQWLVQKESSAAVLMLMELQRQMETMQHTLTTLQQRFQTDQANAALNLDARLGQLGDRLTHLEDWVNHQTESFPAPSLDEPPVLEAAPPTPDPLLARLAPLLDDF